MIVSVGVTVLAAACWFATLGWRAYKAFFAERSGNNPSKSTLSIFKQKLTCNNLPKNYCYETFNAFDSESNPYYIALPVSGEFGVVDRPNVGARLGSKGRSLFEIVIGAPNSQLYMSGSCEEIFKEIFDEKNISQLSVRSFLNPDNLPFEQRSFLMKGAFKDHPDQETHVIHQCFFGKTIILSILAILRAEDTIMGDPGLTSKLLENFRLVQAADFATANLPEPKE